MRAIVIDDSRAMRTIIKKILGQLGFEVFEAGHGKEALERLRTVGSLDLALVDWNMPEMNGYEFICALRAQPEFDPMRVVMVTTESELPNIAKAIEAGANEYVMKPFTPAAIVEKLQLLGMGL